jgi:hypothetical protein
MKDLFKKLLQFLQEKDGELSSRRLVFLFGSCLAIPASYIFAFIHESKFEEIHELNLWFLGALVGLYSLTRFAPKDKEEVKK